MGLIIIQYLCEGYIYIQRLFGLLLGTLMKGKSRQAHQSCCNLLAEPLQLGVTYDNVLNSTHWKCVTLSSLIFMGLLTVPG